jgi:YVTN family beta-propeller protein
MRRRGDDGRALATVMFTDIVGSTELASELGDVHWKEVLATHHGVVRKTLKRYNGKEVDTAGDGFFATFTRPADAIRCASDIIDQLRAIGIHIRAGVHMGEVEQMGAKVGGIGVHIGARVASKAEADEILVSSTVRDLVAGSDIRFGERGVHDLKGVPGEWRLFRVDKELTGDVPDRPLVSAPAAREARKQGVPRPALIVGLVVLVVLAVVGVLAIVLGKGGSSNVVAIPGPNTVSKIDIKSNRFAGTVDVGRTPTDIAVGGGSVWALNSDDLTMSRVDEKTIKASGGARAMSGPPTGIAYGAGSLWVTTQFGQSQPGQAGAVLRINPGEPGSGKRIEVGNGVSAITFGDGSVWAVNEITNTLIQIDPDADAVTATLHVGNNPKAVAAAGGAVWVANALDNSVWKIDEKTMKVVGKFTVGPSPTGLAIDGSNVWVASQTSNTVRKLDANSGTTIATVSVGAQPTAIAAARGVVWVSDDAGHLVERIDAATAKVVARLKVSGSPAGIAIDDSGVWVAVHE